MILIGGAAVNRSRAPPDQNDPPDDDDGDPNSSGDDADPVNSGSSEFDFGRCNENCALDSRSDSEEA